MLVCLQRVRVREEQKVKLQSKEHVESELNEVLKEKEKRQLCVCWKQGRIVFLLDEQVVFLSQFADC